MATYSYRKPRPRPLNKEAYSSPHSFLRAAAWLFVSIAIPVAVFSGIDILQFGVLLEIGLTLLWFYALHSIWCELVRFFRQVRRAREVSSVKAGYFAELEMIKEGKIVSTDTWSAPFASRRR